MPLDHLLAALERDAARQAERVVAEARAEASAIETAAEAERTSRRQEALRERGAALRATAEEAVATARRVARRTVLEARARFLDRVFAAARARFPEAATSAAYRAALPTHIAQARDALGDEPGVIRCAESLAAVVRSALGASEQVVVCGDARAAPGITLSTTDGVVTVDNTLEARLARLEPRLALVVLAALGPAA